MAKEMKPKTKLCKYCKSEIDAKAKVCPYCRKKQKGKLLPIIIAILVLIVLAGSCSGGNDDSGNTSGSAETAKTETTQTADTQKETVEETEKETEKKTEKETEKETEAKVSYTKYKASELEDDLASNALKAKEKYCDQKIKVTGYLSAIDSDGAYITINAGSDDYSFIYITCYITSDEQKDVIMEKSTGDKIVVKGTCTDVGEVLGYYINIDSIK